MSYQEYLSLEPKRFSIEFHVIYDLFSDSNLL